MGGFLVWLMRRNERKALSVVVLFLSTHMWTSLVEVFPTSFPNSKTTDHSSVGRGITIAETPKVELSRKPRVDSGGVHYFETANCLLTIVRVIFIFFSSPLTGQNNSVAL